MTLRPLFGLLAAAILLIVFPLAAQEQSERIAKTDPGPSAGGGAFLIGDLRVDVLAKTPEEARITAFRDAARSAWPQLWARLTGEPVASAPQLPDSAIENMIGGVEVQSERFWGSRYIATLGILFDSRRAGERLPKSARILHSRPLLLLPVLVDGGVKTIYEGKSPWQQAWARFGTDSTPIDYIRAKGTAGDGVLLTGWQARRDNRALWSSILNRYGAENLLVAEAHLDRSYPGGPIKGLFLARHGPDSKILARFTLRAGAAGELDAMLDKAVRRIDAAYSAALQSGALRADSTLTQQIAIAETSAELIDYGQHSAAGSAYIANVVTPDPATWAVFERSLRAVPNISSFRIITLSIGGTSQVSLMTNSDFDVLQYALDQGGLRLEQGERGLRLRHRIAGEAPISPPMRRADTGVGDSPSEIYEGGPSDE